MKVKLLSLDRSPSVGEYDEPQHGRKFVAVKVRLTNVGNGTYSDSPGNGAKLITNKDEQAETTLVSGGDCESSFVSDTKISPGSAQQGCIPFEIKKNQKPKVFQFSLDSGFGPDNR
jgi:hypothetical protein